MDHYRSQSQVGGTAGSSSRNVNIQQQHQHQPPQGTMTTSATYSNPQQQQQPPPPPPPPPPTIRVSAFSRPSSSLLSPKVFENKDSSSCSSNININNNNVNVNTPPPPPPDLQYNGFPSPATIINQVSLQPHHYPTSLVNDNISIHPPHDADPLIANISPSSSPAATAAAGAITKAASPTSSAIKYRECLKNHAASIGGHVLDGCCEFMPSDDDFLKCAACDCHRSFHRKHTTTSNIITSSDNYSSPTGSHYYRRDRVSVPLLLPPPPHRRRNNSSNAAAASSNMIITSPHHQSTSSMNMNMMFSHNYHHLQPHYHHHHPSQKPSPTGVGPTTSALMVQALGSSGNNTSGSGATTESSSEDRVVDATARSTVIPSHPHYGLAVGEEEEVMPAMSVMVVVSKKRHRTKFTAEQKEKMVGFAERLGWRMQRQDEGEMEDFCREIGVKRQVFKVWMHNNKHSIMRKQQQQQQQQIPVVVQQQQQSQPQPLELGM